MTAGNQDTTGTALAGKLTAPAKAKRIKSLSYITSLTTVNFEQCLRGKERCRCRSVEVWPCSGLRVPHSGLALSSPCFLVFLPSHLLTFEKCLHPPVGKDLFRLALSLPLPPRSSLATHGTKDDGWAADNCASWFHRFCILPKIKMNDFRQKNL